MEKASPPKKLNRLSDLPPGKVLDEDFLNISGVNRENVIVYSPTTAPSHGHGKQPGSHHVWVLGTEVFFTKQTTAFFELRKRLTKNNYAVLAQVITDTSIIKNLYENHQEKNAALPGDAAGEDEQDEEKMKIRNEYNKMLAYALREHVSDIHIEKRSTRSIIRMRKHGQLIEYQEISNAFADKFCRVIYNVFAENKDVAFREEIYQSAAVNSVVGTDEVKLRYQSLPVYPGGFDVVLRVLPIGSDEESITPLEKLGYSPSQVKTLLNIASRPVGALIIAGTTGSGKSTTLKNLLMYINNARHYRCKIYTIEDPPEYKIPRVSQIPVIRREDDDPKISPFAAPLKATMRGDPDILMIGEIRDLYTGDGLKKATQSGHQVLTTVHATSALGIVERLVDFGISPSVMGSPEFINGLIYQKLLPILCPHCSVPFKHVLEKNGSAEDMELARRLEAVADLNEHNIKIRGPGCDECKGLGINGRTVCAEIITPDFQMLKHFREQDSLAAKYCWRSQSDSDNNSDNMTGKPVLEHALLKMRQGLVSPYDIEETINPVNAAHEDWKQLEEELGAKTKTR